MWKPEGERAQGTQRRPVWQGTQRSPVSDGEGGGGKTGQVGWGTFRSQSDSGVDLSRSRLTGWWKARSDIVWFMFYVDHSDSWVKNWEHAELETESSGRRPWQRSKKDNGTLDRMVLVEVSREVIAFKLNLEGRADGNCSRATLRWWGCSWCQWNWMNGVTVNWGEEIGGGKMHGGRQEIKNSRLNLLGFIQKWRCGKKATG